MSAMVWRPRQLTRSQQEERRLEAGRLLQAGQLSYADMARRLKALRWSPQQPALYARERDEALVRAWLTHDWPRLKKRLAARRRK